MKRLFCAIKIKPNEAIRDVLNTFREELYGERISWVDPGNLHITLKFFGDTPGKEEADIIGALEEAAARTNPFSFQLKGCGTFGNPGMPRVIWLGVHGAEGLKTLYHNVTLALEPLGHRQPDRKYFVPHLTAGRIKHLKDKDLLNDLLEEYDQLSFGRVAIDRCYLFQSILQPEGPEYRIIQGFDFAS